MARTQFIAPVPPVLATQAYRDPVTGQTYASKAQMVSAIRLRNAALLRDFELSVREDTLGQDPWARLPGETELMYDRFKMYRDLPMDIRAQSGSTRGPLRSIAAVAKAVTADARHIAQMALKWHWRLRAECWDKEMDRQAELAFLDQKRKSARTQAALGQKLQAAASRGADILLSGAVDMSAGEVARLADTGVKIERLAMDKATSHEATVTRFVYEGAKPKWADHSQVVEETEQVEAGPLQQRVRDLTNAQPRPVEDR